MITVRPGGWPFGVGVVGGVLLVGLMTALVVWGPWSGDAPSSHPEKAGRGPAQAPSLAVTPRPERTQSPRESEAAARRTTSPSPSPAPDPAHVFPVADCEVSYSADHHNYPATDIFAPQGCPFVAPIDGVVDEVGAVDGWSAAENRGGDRGGLFVSVVGVDGVRYYGSHLSAVAPRIRPGTTVRAGTRLGSVGETGSARGTGPHLHFGISWPGPPGQWWIRRGVVGPALFLDAWRKGRNTSPAEQVKTAERDLGPQMAECRQYC